MHIHKERTLATAKAFVLFLVLFDELSRFWFIYLFSPSLPPSSVVAVVVKWFSPLLFFLFPSLLPDLFLIHLPAVCLRMCVLIRRERERERGGKKKCTITPKNSNKQQGNKSSKRTQGQEASKESSSFLVYSMCATFTHPLFFFSFLSRKHIHTRMQIDL